MAELPGRLGRFAKKRQRDILQGTVDVADAQLRLILPFSVPRRIGYRLASGAGMAFDVDFDDASAAGEFATWWADSFGPYIEHDLALRLLVGQVYAGIRLRRKDARVTLTVPISEDGAAVLRPRIVAQLQKLVPADYRARRAAREAAWTVRAQGKLPPSAAASARP